MNAFGGNHIPSIHSISNGPARRKQINTLLVFNENVKEVRQDVEYRIFFKADSSRFAVVIYLPNEFPIKRPDVKIFCATQFEDREEDIDPKVRLKHPWLDSENNTVTGAPGLNAFGAHSDLGRVVQAIRREFEKNAPRTLDLAANESNGAIAFKNVSHNKQNTVVTATYNHSQAQQQCFSEINELTKDDLKELLEDDDVAFRQFYQSLDNSVLSEMDKQQDGLKKSIQALISSNRDLSLQLKEKQTSLQVKSTELLNLKEVCNSSETTLKDSVRNLTKRSICDNLNLASHNDELESDQCADQFLRGETQLDDFLSSYIELRKRHHVRKSKSEKLNP